MKKFRVNDYITLKLESRKTNIYVNGKLFTQCKFLLLFIPTNNTRLLEELDSIDGISEELDFSLSPNIEYLEPEKKELIKSVSPETEFWGHCSNLQAWAEHHYDTRLLHSNLSFPLLKKLTEEGDPIARMKFKEEIAKRYFTGIRSVQLYLEEEGYLEFLGEEEFSSFINSGYDVIEELKALLKTKLKITLLKNYHGNIKLKDGEIIGVNLSGLKLKEVPSCIQRLKSLEIFNINSNFLGVIPDWIGELTELRQFDAVNNKLRSLPDAIGKLKSLEFLDLSQNQLKKLPESFRNLISLKKLRLSTNNIEALPESIGNLISLENISLQKNLLKSLPDSIKNLKNLKSIDLSTNPIKALPLSILELPSLEKISIFKTDIQQENEVLNKLNEKIGYIYGYYGPRSYPRRS